MICIYLTISPDIYLMSSLLLLYLQSQEEKLLRPIIDKAKKAIEDVAKENNFTYIFDSGVGVLLYQNDSDDIMPMVKKKLGLLN